jgi:hypothetical protein
VFELRWFKPYVPAKARGIDRPKPVLQYREYGLRPSEHPVARWSDWRDVPTVTEQEKPR